MKTLVFSDTHLTTEFKPALFQALKRAIEPVDRVIINGDFYDGFVVDFSEFVESKWQRLFPLLKEKQTIYIYGNHDKPDMVTEKAQQFSSQQTLKHILKIRDREVIIMHGHTLVPEFDGIFPRVTARFGHYYPFFFRLHYSPTLMGKLYRYLKGYHYRYIMRQLQKHAQTKLKNNQLLLTGHSHQFVDDRDQGFINLAAFQRGRACYAILDDNNGSIKLYNQTYNTYNKADDRN